MKALLDFVPLAAFFVLAKKPVVLDIAQGHLTITPATTGAIFIATQGLLIASVIVYALHFILQKGRLEKSQWITLLLTLAFCGLTLYLHDDIWLRWKSSIINWTFGTAFLISPIVGEHPIPLAKRFLASVFELTESNWKKLNLAWAAFFFILGSLHLAFAFAFPALWIDFKVFGSTAIMIVFMIGQFVLLRSHLKNPEKQS
ncbi:MAG: septation protein IspZ [Candidatus Saccharibacteria bacterium]|nr:septation protein IspZ [Moraxellaceae bacterium]